MELKFAEYVALESPVKCLNRTFMELKCVNVIGCNVGIYTFKSHLYGIEILENNWNRLKQGRFKSHLYGIEIVV